MRFDSHIADRITAVILFALGAAMTYGGYVMDRLEIRQIHPASIPGLTPMLLGAAMMLAALLLFAGSKPAQQEKPAQAVSKGSWANFGFAALLSCVFALFFVGSIPFAVGTALYIAGFTALFAWRDGTSKNLDIATILIAIAFGTATAIAISTLFRYGFLVRLP